MKTPKATKKTNGGGPEPKRQYAALPWRMEGKALQVLVASSRDTRRWVIPKGWPMKGRKPHATAAIEALQEAGLLGKIEKTSIGSYHYQKRLKNGASLHCRVDVFPMRVLRQRKNWPEKNQRALQWVSYEEAAGLVQEAELREIILAFGDAWEAQLVEAPKGRA